MKKKINLTRCLLKSCNRELSSHYKGRPKAFCNSKCRIEWNELYPNEEGGAYGFIKRNYSSI